MMHINILTLFPEMFSGPFSCSMLKRAQENGYVAFQFIQIRDFTFDKHHQVDDVPFGGGPGMVMKPEPVFRALESIERTSNSKIILMSPQGKPFDQVYARQLASLDQLILICGRYEGVDERIRQYAIDEELSIGDYVLTGGELASMVVVDAVVRLIPGVLGAADGTTSDSFHDNLLEYPQYTRPRLFQNWSVPDILLSGHHEAIARWRRDQSLLRTLERRPDLLQSATLSKRDIAFLTQIQSRRTDADDDSGSGAGSLSSLQ